MKLGLLAITFVGLHCTPSPEPETPPNPPAPAPQTSARASVLPRPTGIDFVLSDRMGGEVPHDVAEGDLSACLAQAAPGERGHALLELLWGATTVELNCTDGAGIEPATIECVRNVLVRELGVPPGGPIRLTLYLTLHGDDE